MKLIFKQRFFSWFDSYDIYNEAGETEFTVEGKLAWGHRMHILNKGGTHVGTVKQVMMTFLPKFELYIGDSLIGCISKELSFFKPRYDIDFNGWSIAGDWLEWDYTICDALGNTAAKIYKEPFNFTDTYSIDVTSDNDALLALMVVLAIDAEKCSRN